MPATVTPLRQRAMFARSICGRRSPVRCRSSRTRWLRSARRYRGAAAISVARNAGGNWRGSPPLECIASSGEDSFPTKTKTVVLFIAQGLSSRLRVRPSSVLAHRRGPTCPGHGRNDAYVNGSGTDLNPHNRADRLQTIARLIPGSEFPKDLVLLGGDARLIGTSYIMTADAHRNVIGQSSVQLEPRVEFHELVFEGSELTFELPQGQPYRSRVAAM